MNLVQSDRKKIGDVLVEQGLLRREWVPKILEYSREKSVRFGEAAVALKYVKPEQIERALKEPYQNEVIFRLVPEYFPVKTRDCITIEKMLKWGVLPLGHKTVKSWFRSEQKLNLGLVNRTQRKAQVQEICTDLALGDDVIWHTVLPDEFFQIVMSVYGLNPQQISARELEASLQTYWQLGDVHGA